MMFFQNINAALSRGLQFHRCFFKNENITKNLRSFYTGTYPLHFQSSPILCAEPLKKKRRIDPAIIRERAEKKIRRLQRDIRRLEKSARQYKPLSELELPKKVVNNAERVRPPTMLSEEEIWERTQLQHLWSVHKRKEHVTELLHIQKMISAQEHAMDKLQEISPELYEMALQPDPTLIPFKMCGPVETPPIERFDYPDGEHIDITKKYVAIVPLDPKKQRKLGFHGKKK